MLILGDCIEKLKELEENSIDAIVTDPPYGLEFMGKEWDSPWKYNKMQPLSFLPNSGRLPSFNPNRNPMCKICHKPKRGSKKCQCINPQFDDIDRKIEDMKKFQLWCNKWAIECLRVLKPGGLLLAFGGTRTYHRLACGIEDAGFEIRDQLQWIHGKGIPKNLTTTLKPAHEPICLARKPLSERNVALNVLKWGTGALNIDACRIGNEKISIHNAPKGTFAGGPNGRGSDTNSYRTSEGRYPSNILLDEEAGKIMDKQAPKTRASRFFYCAKASKKEKSENNTHPTVKPVKLIRYLVRLVCRSGGTVLDPFMGSGTTGIACKNEGMNFIGIEKENEYFKIAQARIEKG